MSKQTKYGKKIKGLDPEFKRTSSAMTTMTSWKFWHVPRTWQGLLAGVPRAELSQDKRGKSTLDFAHVDIHSDDEAGLGAATICHRGPAPGIMGPNMPQCFFILSPPRPLKKPPKSDGYKILLEVVKKKCWRSLDHVHDHKPEAPLPALDLLTTAKKKKFLDCLSLLHKHSCSWVPGILKRKDGVIVRRGACREARLL